MLRAQDKMVIYWVWCKPGARSGFSVKWDCNVTHSREHTKIDVFRLFDDGAHEAISGSYFRLRQGAWLDAFVKQWEESVTTGYGWAPGFVEGL